VFGDPNIAAYGRSIYEIRDQWKFNIDFSREFFGDNETRISLFGEYRTGRPYSVVALESSGSGGTTRGQVFGTVGTGNRHLLYVPTVGDTRVSFDNPTSEANFNALVGRLGLEKFRGKVLPKNSQDSPDFFKIDLSVSQELPLFVGNAKLRLFADIENVLNIIDSDWGALRQVAFPYAATVATVQCLNTRVATGSAPAAGEISSAPVGNVTPTPAQQCVQYRYSAVTNPNVDLVSRQSLYGIRVGVKVSF
jgi:hypothetical protein